MSGSELKDTIFALATPFGKSAISVVRISGSGSQTILEKLSNDYKKIIHKARTQVYTPFRNPEDGEILDFSLITFFEKGKSYTGEDSVEISLHGSPFLVQSLFSILSNLGLRPARAGEFTERAYLNGKLDLSQAEAVCDLINSETRLQAKASKEQLAGRLGKAVDEVGEPLRNLLAEIEANIDFPDEDINPSKPKEWLHVLKKVQGEIKKFVESYAVGKLYREGALIVLTGIPNAGKSSLMNALLREDRVIVTDIPGTTRDVIEEKVQFGGVLCRIVDTAGLASQGDPDSRTLDPVEKIGIERSYQFCKKADLVIYLFDRSQAEKPQVTELEKIKEISQAPVLLVLSKSDLKFQDAMPQSLSAYEKVFVSSLKEEGILELEKNLATRFVEEEEKYPVIFTNLRHKECLEKALEHTVAFETAISENQHLELISFELRACLSSLAEIVGSLETEDILGRIFSKFCIGK